MRGRFVLEAAVVASTLLLALALVTGSAAAERPVVEARVRAQATTLALTQVGKPYVWGAASPVTGFDSPGLVVWAYGRTGVRTLPHDAQALWRDGVRVRRSELRVGDLVFFDDGAHVGVYVGGGGYVHAPHTGADVRVDTLGVGELARHYSGAVRLFSASARRG